MADGLYLAWGPGRRKTLVHLLDLLGCLAVGPIPQESLAAIPDAIRSYLRFQLDGLCDDPWLDSDPIRCAA